MLHIFKEDQKELGFIDLRYVTGAIIDTYAPCIILNISGTGELEIEYDDKEQCTLEFLRLTTAMQDVIDKEPELFMMEIGDED